MVESFFPTLKAEIIDAQVWSTRAAARMAIFAWIEVLYNRQRAHSTLAYQPRTIFEEVLSSDHATQRYAIRESEVASSAK